MTSEPEVSVVIPTYNRSALLRDAVDSVLVQDTQRSTIGGEINYKLAQIVRAEPDAGLFRVPPDYTRQELPVRYGSQLTSKPLSPAVRIKP